MTKGITLIAIGDPVYGKWAYNMALFLKYHSPNIPIQLIYEPKTLAALGYKERKMFTYKDEAKQEHYYDSTDGFCPAKIKMNMYEYFRFDHTIYLDVDGYLCKDITPLFDECINDYYTTVIGQADKQRPDFPEMKWADKNHIFEHYNLPDDAIIPATNSSFQSIKKSETCDNLFKQIQANFENRIPTQQLTLKWGNNQPDELYLNVALAQLRMMPKLNPEPVCYRREEKLKPNIDHQKYYVISCFGIKNHVHSSVLDNYDIQLQLISKQLFNQHRKFKVRQLMSPKFIHT